MLDEYTTAFARYLRTGTVGALSDYCGENADPVRLRVYRNGFMRACVEALRAGYPSVEQLVGEERFPALARPYVETRPPRVASLVEYGEDFPRFIKGAYDTHRLDHLASFATLDRAWSEVWFAEDADGPKAIVPAGPFGDAEALMHLRGRLAPWARLESLRYRVLHAWIRLRRDKLGQRTEVRRAPQHILVWRSGADVLHRELTCPEHAFIAGVAGGRPCGEAAGAALDIDAEFDLVETFAALLHHRLLVFERRSGGAAAPRPAP